MSPIATPPSCLKVSGLIRKIPDLQCMSAQRGRINAGGRRATAVGCDSHRALSRRQEHVCGVDLDLDGAGVARARLDGLEAQALGREVDVEVGHVGGAGEREGAVRRAVVADDLEAADLRRRAHRAGPEADPHDRRRLGQLDLDPGVVAVAVRRPLRGGVAVDGAVAAPAFVERRAAEGGADRDDARAVVERGQVVLRAPAAGAAVEAGGGGEGLACVDQEEREEDAVLVVGVALLDLDAGADGFGRADADARRLLERVLVVDAAGRHDDELGAGVCVHDGLPAGGHGDERHHAEGRRRDVLQGSLRQARVAAGA